MPTNDVGGTSAALPGKIKNTYGEEVLTAFYDYSREVFNRRHPPFILTQGKIWHDWLHTAYENIEFISLSPIDLFIMATRKSHHHFVFRVDLETKEITSLISF